MKLKQSMKMQMRTSPQLVLAGELLRISGVDLEHRVRQELENNPALEQTGHNPVPKERRRETTNQWVEKSLYCKYGPGKDQRELPEFEQRLEKIAHEQSINSQLIAQAALLVSGEDLETVTALLYMLDSNGYLQASPEQLSAQLGLKLIDIERLIPVLHELEPPGIGARDLRECLLIQCFYLEEEGSNCSLTKRVLEQAWEDFAAQRWERIVKKLGISKEEVESVQQFIVQNLCPYPLASMNDNSAISRVLNSPDLIIHRQIQNGELAFSLEIPAAEVFEIRLSENFTAPLERSATIENYLSNQEREWLLTYLERARLFIASLQKRWETLRRTGEYVIEYQKDFLEGGASRLRPLTQAMVARALGCHESTVSRAVNQKVVQLPNGRLVSMEIFFDASLPVKAALRQILAESRSTISDREMAKCLANAGYSIARRTVTKYRAQINHINGL